MSPSPRVQVPQFYAPVPPAPAGLIWYQYAPGVPALPNVSSVLGSAYSRYTWIYDSSYSTSSFQFSDLDKVLQFQVLSRVRPLRSPSNVPIAVSRACVSWQFTTVQP